MVFLGYILPKKNQEDYLKEIEIAVQNYRNDLLNKFNLKAASAVTTVQTQVQTPVQAAPALATASPAPVPVQTQVIPMQTPVQAPAKSPLKVDIPKPSSTLISELEGKIKSPNLGLKSKPASPESKPPSPESKPSSPTPSEATTVMTYEDMEKAPFSAEMSKLLSEYGVDGDQSKFYKKAEKVLIQSIRDGKQVYGSSSNRTRKRVDDERFLLSAVRNEDGKYRLAWANSKGKQPFDQKNLKMTLKINEPVLYSQGSGIRRSIKVRNPDNFHGFHLSPLGLSKNDISIYYPNSSRRVLSWKNMSPMLSKIVGDIRKDKSFKIDDYERLKESERVVVDKIITLLRLLYPAGMKRASEEEIWNLRNRYAILLGEINSGNNSILLREELADIVNRLKEFKVISSAKQKFILNALTAK